MSPDVNQQINIIATFQSKLGGMNKAIATLDKLKQANVISNKEYQKELVLLKKSDPQLYKLALKQKTFEERQKRINKAQRDGTSGARRMTGAYLSLMFTGMALTRVFGGMIKGVLDLLGISDLWSATLLVLLLPALMPLIDVLIDLMLWLMDLPEPIQKIIGYFILLAAGVGILMTFFGMLGVFLTGAATLLGFLVTPLGLVLVGLATLVGYTLWKSYFKDMGIAVDFIKDKLSQFGVNVDFVDKIMTFFGKLKDKIVAWIVEMAPKLIEGGYSFIMALVEGMINNIGEISNAIMTLINVIIDWINRNITSIINAGTKIVMALVTGLENNIPKITDTILKILFALIDVIVKNLPQIINVGLKMTISLAQGIANNADKLVSALVEAVGNMLKWILTHPAQIIQIGLEIAKAIVVGIGKGLLGAGEGILNSLLGKKSSKSSSKIPSFAGGGVMPYTGLAQLHAGETITPAGQNINSAPVINITATLSNDMDVRKLADQLSRYWTSDYERITKSRGMV